MRRCISSCWPRPKRSHSGRKTVLRGFDIHYMLYLNPRGWNKYACILSHIKKYGIRVTPPPRLAWANIQATRILLRRGAQKNMTTSKSCKCLVGQGVLSLIRLELLSLWPRMKIRTNMKEWLRAQNSSRAGKWNQLESMYGGTNGKKSTWELSWTSCKSPGQRFEKNETKHSNGVRTRKLVWVLSQM